MTRNELLAKIKTREGRVEIAEKIASVWWERFNLDDAEQWYVYSTVHGYEGLLSCTEEEWLEHAEDAGLLEDDGEEH